MDKSRGDVYHELISVLTVDIYIFQLGLTQPRAFFLFGGSSRNFLNSSRLCKCVFCWSSSRIDSHVLTDRPHFNATLDKIAKRICLSTAPFCEPANKTKAKVNSTLQCFSVFRPFSAAVVLFPDNYYPAVAAVDTQRTMFLSSLITADGRPLFLLRA